MVRDQLVCIFCRVLWAGSTKLSSPNMSHRQTQLKALEGSTGYRKNESTRCVCTSGSRIGLREERYFPFNAHFLELVCDL